jgi:hypothetical protein
MTVGLALRANPRAPFERARYGKPARGSLSTIERTVRVLFLTEG